MVVSLPSTLFCWDEEENVNEAITMLKADMRDEHAAIIQYLQHAYAIGEGEEACEIEAIARDEMRHLRWLAEMVVELGGDPTMERSEVDRSGAGPVEWMARDIAAEEGAIAQYKEHIAAIDIDNDNDNPRVVRLLKRILSDEVAHKEAFSDLAEELAEEAAEAEEAAQQGEAVSPRVLEILNQGVRHEYTVILQYLYHSFVVPHCDVGRELDMQAINEMQHMGWLAEEVAESGGHPRMEHAELALEGDTTAMLEADIAAEREVTRVYGRQIAELEDAELKALLTRIREHEIYHDELFNDLLERVQERE